MVISSCTRFLILMVVLSLVSTANAQTLDILVDSQRMYDTNTDLPGVGFTATSFSDPTVDDFGNVSSDFTPDSAFAVIDGTLRFIAEGGVTLLPGTTEVISNFDDHVEISKGKHLFYVRNVGVTDDDAIIFGDHLGLELVLRENVTEVPGQAPGTVFDSLSNTEGIGTDGTSVVFRASFPGGRGVYLYENGNRSVIVDSGDSFGGLPFTFFQNPMLDANGTGIVFTAERDFSIASIFLYDNGTLTELLSTEDNFPGTANLITGFGEVDIDRGRVVIQAEGAGGEDGILLIDGSNITVVADLSTNLPGIPAGSIFNNAPGIGGDYVGFQTAGGPGFMPTYWVWHDGFIKRIVGPGDTFDGTTVLSVDTPNRPYIADGFMAVSLELDDGTSAVYRLSLQAVGTALPIPVSNVAIPLAALLLLLGLIARRKYS